MGGSEFLSVCREKKETGYKKGKHMQPMSFTHSALSQIQVPKKTLDNILDKTLVSSKLENGN